MGLVEPGQEGLEEIIDDPMLDGVIKFLPRCISPTPPPFPTVLNHFIENLKEAGLIGVYSDGTGHGNGAVLLSDGSMVATATQTQKYRFLDEKGYVLIPPEADVDQEEVPFVGMQNPSSESRTLLAIARKIAVVREPISVVAAVIHIHHQEGQLRAAKLGLPESASRYRYGTVGFAHEAVEVVDRIKGNAGGFGTPSHLDGLFFYAPTVGEAYQLTVDYIDRVIRTR